MNRIIFKCEIITPMFSSGYDGRTLELRATEIKASMRYWWRAINERMNIDELKEIESKIFGGSGKSQGKSSFNIKINYENNLNKINYSPLPHRSQLKPQAAFSNGNHFNVELILWKGPIEYKIGDTTEKFNLETLKNLFILSSLLGGIGKRSRRGFGSYRIVSINKESFNFDYSLNQICNLINQISIDNYEVKGNKIVYKNNKNIANYPYILEIEIGKEYKSLNDILKKIGEASHKYNSVYTGFAYKTLRLASPIYVSVIKINNTYRPLVTTLYTYFCEFKTNEENTQMKFKEEIL